MLIILENITSTFLIIGLGFGISKLNLISDEANKHLTDLLFTVISPCMLFSTITGRELTSETLNSTLLTLVIGVILLIIWTAMSFVLCSKVIKIKSRQDIGVLMLLFTSLNTGFMGFPITLEVFGEKIFYLMVIFNIVLTVFVFSFGFIIIEVGSSDFSIRNFSIKGLGSSFKNICTISAFISLLMLFCGIHFPPVIFRCIETIGNSTVPISMLMVGMQLSRSNFRESLKNRSLAAVSFLKMLVIPFITFLIVNPLPIITDIKICVIFGSMFPSAVALVPLSTLKNKNTSLAAEGVTLTTLISIFVIPIGAVFLAYFYKL